MQTYHRRNFLKATAGLLSMAFAGTSFDIKENKPLLSFSTLGCPDWTFKKITDFAVANDYLGIEIRTIQRQMDLTKCLEFSSARNIAATLNLLKEKGLKIVDLGSSAALHYKEVAERKKNLDEAKQYIDLASKLECPYVRVFPNNYPKDQDKNETIDLIISGLIELGNYAKGTNVTVLMETHGEVLESDVLQKIMQSSEQTNVGLIWDIVNMWVVTKEPPSTVYPKLKKYIRHTHIKDLNLVNGKEEYVLLGKGESPVFDGIDALVKGGYKGYYSFEWEKLWHPEIAESEVALADYPRAMKQHFKEEAI